MLVIPSRTELRLHPLTTTRLQLAPIEPGDTSDLWDAVDSSRAHLQPWLPWVPFNSSLDASLRYAEACAGDWDAGRACRCTIRDRASGALVGVVGFETLAHVHENSELGYWLCKEVTGRGYMLEAAGFFVSWGFARLNMHRIRVAAATDNHASLRVIHRLGFRFEGIARQAELCDGRWLDHAVYAMLSTDPRR
jgi:ribosomal-protein-serine acetyltransferase